MASHPSPFYRQRQSNKTLDPTGQTAKFLYTILKQLDLKNIDWNEVAGNLDITNGHAARMRWSRFRAQIEGLDNSYSRQGGKKDAEKKRRKERQAEEITKSEAWNSDIVRAKRMKTEPDGTVARAVMGKAAGREVEEGYGQVKHEPAEPISVVKGINVHHPTITSVPLPQTPVETPHQSMQSSSASRPTTSRGSYQASSTMPLRPMNTSDVSSQQMASRWQQQYSNPANMRSVCQPSSTSSSYYPTSSMYSNQYYHPNVQLNQPQPRYFYGQPMMQGSYQPHQAYMYNGMNTYNYNSHPHPLGGAAAQPPSSSLQPQLPQPSPTSQANSESVAVAASHLSQIQSTEGPKLPTQEEAIEIASQASYPWPYSEASLPDMLDHIGDLTESVQTTQDDGNKPCALDGGKEGEVIRQDQSTSAESLRANGSSSCTNITDGTSDMFVVSSDELAPANVPQERQKASVDMGSNERCEEARSMPTIKIEPIDTLS